VADEERIVIAVSDLRNALSRLLDAATERFGPLIDLDADYYWAINPRTAFDLQNDPTFETGQLSDDVETIGELLSRDDGEVILWHDLEHVIAILQRLSNLDMP
jgi:hypothetical protein